jgi:hypothetical protein
LHQNAIEYPTHRFNKFYRSCTPNISSIITEEGTGPIPTNQDNDDETFMIDPMLLYNEEEEVVEVTDTSETNYKWNKYDLLHHPAAESESGRHHVE